MIGLLVVWLTKPAEKEQPAGDEQPALAAASYVGSASCAGCHKDIYASHMQTAHFKTTMPATEEAIQGSFDTNNSYRFSEKTIVRCEKIGGKLYQVAYVNGVEKMRQAFDIVFGYGREAQSFGAWSGNKLVQLPLSYFSKAEQWINSPGYPDKVVFNRVITSRCMECHASGAKVISQQGPLEDFDRSSVILGIDCEKCHGPASGHLEFERSGGKTAAPDRGITNLVKLTRQQSLDLCAVCHSGNIEPVKPSFSFRPGDRLADFFVRTGGPTDTASLDVHGNQYGLLTASNCFINSEMTCGSCHNSHKNEEGALAVFSQRCMTCHQSGSPQFCTVSGLSKETITQNCVDCHMPEKKSATIVFANHSSGVRTAATMRTHLVKVYPDEAKAIKLYLKNKSAK